MLTAILVAVLPHVVKEVGEGVRAWLDRRAKRADEATALARCAALETRCAALEARLAALEGRRG